MAVEIRVPTLGESVTEATVATWFKKLGDFVAVDEMLCELETDKVTVEVPSPVAGRLVEIVAPEGTTVGVAALLAQARGDFIVERHPARDAVHDHDDDVGLGQRDVHLAFHVLRHLVA
jgi:2-oxoglutarate dehydrogenase E2 component (dihydrolipoamide succinyltransferase)